MFFVSYVYLLFIYYLYISFSYNLLLIFFSRNSSEYNSLDASKLNRNSYKDLSNSKKVLTGKKILVL